MLRLRLRILITVCILLLVPAAGARKVAAAQDTLRVVAYNIKHGRGMDDRVDLERIAEVLRRLDPDVVALQEVDNRTERTGGVDQVGRLGELLDMEAFHGAHRAYQGGEYGNAVLTRLPVLDVRTHPIPSLPDGRLTVHEIRVAVGERRRPVSVVAVHLAGTPDYRLRQADTVTAVLESADHPVILAGDFNGRRGDAVLSRLQRDWDVLDKTGPPETYPADAPDREIDFFMVRGSKALELLEHRVIEEPLASDHRPVLAVFRYMPPSAEGPYIPGTGRSIRRR